MYLVLVFPYCQICSQWCGTTGILVTRSVAIRACRCCHPMSRTWLRHLMHPLPSALLRSFRVSSENWWVNIWCFSLCPAIFARNRIYNIVVGNLVLRPFEECAHLICRIRFFLINAWHCMFAWHAINVPPSTSTCISIDINNICFQSRSNLPQPFTCTYWPTMFCPCLLKFQLLCIVSCDLPVWISEPLSVAVVSDH